MTTVTHAQAADVRPSGATLPTLVIVVGGAGALLARPWMTRLLDDPTVLLVSLFVLLGAAGALWPLSARPHPARAHLHPMVVVGVGVVAFAAARVLAGAPAAWPLAGQIVALHTLAAVAEEAFFRRLVYGALSRHGDAVAVVGSAIAFAVVHVTVWGLWVLPLDLGAGLILSWQRWASGGWATPAVTHVVANVLAVA